MGNAGSKVCESEKFEQHQQGFARASEAFPQKRPRSPGSDKVQDGSPQAKRSRHSDDQIEEVRRDLEQRFEALRSQAGLQAGQSTEIHAKAVEGDSSGSGFDLGARLSSPPSCATLGHSELADGPDEQSDDSMLWVPDSRPPSPELLSGQIDEHVGYGWSTRNTNADLAELSSTLLLTNDWPDYASAFRKPIKQNVGDTSVDDEQLRRNKLGIELANSALRQIDLEPDTIKTGTPTPKARANRALDADDTSRHMPHSDRVANAFGEPDTARDMGDRSRRKVLSASKYLVGLGRQ
ncbi:hypothetical protein HII31_05193 [Pseudocercospora fuligena]|uniref:Uncharacterized protein n=1 Tax=Pseudocercospora fuligena TaxID=685502 RepID=A0A8H6VME9_9PEZI|nr:hypothetical protein HII31_05193 [Pseudocercospora fuligena]